MFAPTFYHFTSAGWRGVGLTASAVASVFPHLALLADAL